MPEDAVSVAPHVYKVLLENDRVRVLDSRMKPGETTSMHSHPDIVAYPLTAGKAKFTFPDDQSMEVELKAGEAMFMEGHHHIAENTGAAEMHVLLIELK